MRKVKNPYIFLKIEEEMMKKNGGFLWEHSEFMRDRNEQDNEQSQWARENWKVFKTSLKIILIMQNMRFSRLEWVVNKSPMQVAKNPCDKILKNLSKCFSRLEVPLASQSHGEPQNLLSNPHNWSFHSQTSRQTESHEF